MSKETCLHCFLVAAVAEWTALNRRADNEAIIEMVGQFAAEVLAERGGKRVSILILNKTFDSTSGTLH